MPNQKTAQTDDGTVVKLPDVDWQGEDSNKMVSLIVEDYSLRNALFRDSHEQKEGTKNSNTSGKSKAACHKEIAELLFKDHELEDYKVAWSTKDGKGKYQAAVGNRLASMKNTYSTFMKTLEETGQGMASDEREFKQQNLIDQFRMKYPWFDSLHPIWKDRPNFNPICILTAERNQDHAGDLRSLVETDDERDRESEKMGTGDDGGGKSQFEGLDDDACKGVMADNSGSGGNEQGTSSTNTNGTKKRRSTAPSTSKILAPSAANQGHKKKGKAPPPSQKDVEIAASSLGIEVNAEESEEEEKKPKGMAARAQWNLNKSINKMTNVSYMKAGNKRKKYDFQEEELAAQERRHIREVELEKEKMKHTSEMVHFEGQMEYYRGMKSLWDFNLEQYQQNKGAHPGDPPRPPLPPA